MSVSAISPGVRADVSSSKTSSDHATYYTLYPNSTQRNLPDLPRVPHSHGADGV